LSVEPDFTNEPPERSFQPMEHFPENPELIFSRKETTSDSAVQLPEDKITFKKFVQFLVLITFCSPMFFGVALAVFCIYLGDKQEERWYNKKQLEEKKA